MLSTIVLSLLAIWLTIVIGGQLIGMFIGWKFWQSLNDDKEK